MNLLENIQTNSKSDKNVWKGDMTLWRINTVFSYVPQGENRVS